MFQVLVFGLCLVAAAEVTTYKNWNEDPEVNPSLGGSNPFHFHEKLASRRDDELDNQNNQLNSFLNTKYFFGGAAIAETATRSVLDEKGVRRPKLRPSKTTKFRHSTKVVPTTQATPNTFRTTIPRTTTSTTTTTTTTSTTTTEAPTTLTSFISQKIVQIPPSTSDPSPSPRPPPAPVLRMTVVRKSHVVTEQELPALQGRSVGHSRPRPNGPRLAAVMQQFCTKICS